MEKNPRLHLPSARAIAAAVCLLLPVLCGGCGKSGKASARLNETDLKIMGQYDQIRAALASDDLRTAKKTAAALAETLKPAVADAPASPMQQSAEALANATALDRCRQVFKAMSAEAIRMTNGAQGYYVINCPMTPEGDWVQTDTKVDNPYMGKIMRDCGAVKK